jgi:very-short-patch-repair endonuclease
MSRPGLLMIAARPLEILGFAPDRAQHGEQSRMPDVSDLARDRTTRIFQFLKAFHDIRHPVARVVTESSWLLWLDEAPETTESWVASIGEVPSDAGTDDQEDPNLVLRVRRPQLHECPALPGELDGWIKPDWRTPDNAVSVIATRPTADRPEGIEEAFSESPARVAALRRWEVDRRVWAHREIPLRRADALFQRLYELYGRLRRESERFELVMGDGLLVWKDAGGNAHHPVLLQSVQLEFDPDVPEFRITELERESELYTALLGCFGGVNGAKLAECRDEILRGHIHPLLEQATNGFLKRLALLLNGRGVAYAGRERPAPEEYPQFYRRPVLFVRPRSAGFTKVLEGILDDIASGSEIPSSLRRVAGISDAQAEDAGEGQRGGFDPGDALLSKETNEQQFEIIQRLHDHGAVLVQGPPGTGKSHTIANLIGHLLAHGQTVLVTSHTTKALGVLRNHVVEELRPLCVSVLDNDVESRRQLEDAVTHISQRLSAKDKSQYSREASTFAAERNGIKDELRKARVALRDARLDEHREVVVGVRSLSPCDAAKLVAARQSHDSWIPGRVDAGAALPLSATEVAELYATNERLSASDEAALEHPLPDVRPLPTPQQFEKLLRPVAAHPIPDRPEWWTNAAGTSEPEDISESGRRLVLLVNAMASAPGWQQAAAAAAAAFDGATQPWIGLADRLDEAAATAASSSGLLLQNEVWLPDEGTPAEHESIATDILAHVNRKGSLGMIAKLRNRSWSRFVDDTRVNGEAPRTKEQFRAIKAEATLRRLRYELEKRWTRMMEPGGASSWKDLGPTPETACSQFAAEIRRTVDWYTGQISPEIERLRTLGFRWDAFLETQPARTGSQASLERLVAAVNAVASLVNGRIDAALVNRRDREFKELLSHLRSDEAPASPSRSALAKAVETRDPRAYRHVYEHVERLTSLRDTFQRRSALVAALQPLAPDWAKAIRNRTGAHGHSGPPGEPESAWEWTQVHAELEKRASRSLPELQSAVHVLEERLREVTTRLIDRRAWASQMERTQLRQQQALIGWLDLVKRIGKGTGKRVPELRAQAAAQMRDCRGSVPVWIMPLSRVADSFDPGTRFDVVIMDEASQSDVMGLVALYLGKKIVVVGDHEQVSPSAVGQQLGRVSQLIDQYLPGIPNSALYDGRTSVYDLARQSFGGLICLTEHFRCYPDIIEFSNWLSYGGRIKAVREPGARAVTPFVVPHRVLGAERTAKTNSLEAQHVASLIIACVAEPEYEAKTFGAISLLGDDQALEIDRLLRQHLSEPEYVRRRVLCGNAAHFQGDERDIIFLSMVYAGNGAPLTKLDQPMYQQRFNVAASRARDQLWVAYSLDPNIDLKPGDLRRRLIEHALDPGSRARQLQTSAARTESDFERRVLEFLVGLGFHVRPQHRVGSYRIDMVVQAASGERLAVECDGDRFHTLENLEQDMARQALLERLGWKFARIRGTQFYRDPATAMAPVLRKLSELGIEPVGAQPASRPPSCVHQRVLARAGSIRAEWQSTPSASEEDSPAMLDQAPVLDEASVD